MTMFGLLILAQAAAAQPVPLAPSGQWTLEHGEHRCALSRAFGSGSEARTFALVSEFAIEVPEMLVIEPQSPRQQRDSFDVRISIDGQPSTESKAKSFQDKTTKQHVTRVKLTPALKQAVAAARAIDVTGAGFAFAISVNGMPKAYAAFDGCVRDLAVKLGFDLAMRDAASGSEGPIGNVSGIFGPDAFPRGAFGKAKTSAIMMLLTKNTSGQVTACKVLMPSGSAQIDSGICAIAIRRVRFKPALDKAGNAVPAQEMLRIDWQRYN